MRLAPVLVKIAVAQLGEKSAAEEPKPEPSIGKSLKAIGIGTLGLGSGIAAGYGAGKLTDYVSRKVTGSPVPIGVTRASPLIGAGLGTAYGLWKAHEAKVLRDAVEGK